MNISDNINLEIKDNIIIKIMGVGGGGCNAINYLYSQGIQGVSLMVCNTDQMSLAKSEVPAKLQLGPGLGAGGDPEIAREFAEENIELIREVLNDGTKMLFIAAGMGGGTGTGASPIVAKVAKDLGILTVAVVTIPFAFEGNKKIEKAMEGVKQLAAQVDAIVVINNEKLCLEYPDFTWGSAFEKSDDVVSNSVRAVSEIITLTGYVNTDFRDVRRTLTDSGVAIIGIGKASGENRVANAIFDALHSPLTNTDIKGAKRLLLQIYSPSKEHALLMSEMQQIRDFVKEIGKDVEVQWGTNFDDTLGENIRITVIAAGYPMDNITNAASYYDESPETSKDEVTTQPKTEEGREEPSIEQKNREEEVDENGNSDYDDEEEVIIEFNIPNQPTPADSKPSSSTPKTSTQQSSQTSLFPGWMRGRNR